LRNQILRDMARLSPPGKRVRLPSGQEVIFWFNVGKPGPPRARVLVTESKCPHQGVCLLKSELAEIEDSAGARHAMVRCPRHNKRFDLRTGLSPGNAEALKTFPCRFEHGHWYVGVKPVDSAKEAAEEPPKIHDIASIVATLVASTCEDHVSSERREETTATTGRGVASVGH
jgi:nitrite reductase/ring-hydroxylating ferredoxin subunit